MRKRFHDFHFKTLDFYKFIYIFNNHQLHLITLKPPSLQPIKSKFFSSNHLHSRHWKGRLKVLQVLHINLLKHAFRFLISSITQNKSHFNSTKSKISPPINTRFSQHKDLSRICKVHTHIS